MRPLDGRERLIVCQVGLALAAADFEAWLVVQRLFIRLGVTI